VKGYIIGSEDYIPAKDYSHKIHSSHMTWQYAFEKQWLFYNTWGRLLYNPNTPNEVFESSFNKRYGTGVGRKMLKAYTLASNMPLQLASFYRATWDFTLYSEGFLAPAESGGLFDKVSPFISINELIDHITLDPTYYSIPDFVDAYLSKEQDIDSSMLTPLDLAESLERDAKVALELVETLPKDAAERNLETLECEIADVKAWANLSYYFAAKLRGGVSLEMFRKTGEQGEKNEAILHLQKAAHYWEEVVAVTESHYNPTPTVELDDQQFSWANYSDQVQRDIQIARQAKPNESTK
jgi:phage-related protein